MSDVTITDQNFNEEVMKSTVPVVVDFWAPWCAPCRIVGPIIEELAKEFEGKVKVGKMNVDDNTQTAGQFGIMSIPTVMVFKDGKPVKSLVGAQSKDTYKNAVNEALSS